MKDEDSGGRERVTAVCNGALLAGSDGAGEGAACGGGREGRSTKPPSTRPPATTLAPPTTRTTRRWIRRREMSPHQALKTPAPGRPC